MSTLWHPSEIISGNISLRHTFTNGFHVSLTLSVIKFKLNVLVLFVGFSFYSSHN